VQVDFERSFIMADIPGLIEGAHAGVGLGDEFLRHIQRAGILVHLVEPDAGDGSDPLDNYWAIRSELAQYDAELVERPEIVVVTKADLGGVDRVQARLSKAIGQAVMLISAVNGEGLNELVRAIARVLATRPDQHGTQQ
jgi:GTP-binding protein